MKRLFLSALFAIALALPLHAQVSATLGGGQAERVAILEAPRSTIIASNASTAQIDFRQGVFQYTNGIVVGTKDYEVKNLNTGLALYLTNIVPGVERTVYITTDGTARDVNVYLFANGGFTNYPRLSYEFSAGSTNSAGAVTITNRGYLTFKVRPAGEVHVKWGWMR